MVDGPLIVQSDRTVLLEVAHPDAETARHELAVFAELERAPEHIHTYRITRLGLWNARAAGHAAEDMLETLDRWSRFPVPASVSTDIRETVNRYGRLTIARNDEGALILRSTDPAVLSEVARNKRIQPLLVGHPAPDTYVVDAWARGHIKQELLKIGWPAEDLAGYTPGTPHPIDLDESSWQLRPYQRQAVDAFEEGGSGVVVLPCGAGKTLVGAGAMAGTKTTTLILVTNTVSARQWRDELLRRTSLQPEEIGEYSGQVKEIKPVTIATYQILTAKRKGQYAHLALLDALDWGLIVYDEVHLLPAPVFKLTADLQARRRLGLTATLVREDGREGDVFSLIGPKRFDAPWKEIEAQGFISPAACYEVRIDLPAGERLEYAAAADEDRYRLAATAPAKIDVVRGLVQRHADERILVIGQYLDQIDELAQALDAPQITGATPVAEREELFQAFREGTISLLVVSKVANFSVDLPEASVAIQVSGSFGSRQEEAQRLGRLLRPKTNGHTASFYTLIARDTVDQDFAQNRQRFLAEQGYAYTILDADDLLAPAA
jgi:DNA excision repair protein ERCC-3